MPTRILVLLCLVATFACGTAEAATAALKCRAVRGAIDKAICTSPEYLAMDHEIGALVDLGDLRFSAEDRRVLAQSQTRYLERRAGCQWAAHNSAHPGAAVDECLRTVMEAREKVLRGAVDRNGFASR